MPREAARLQACWRIARILAVSAAKHTYQRRLYELKRLHFGECTPLGIRHQLVRKVDCLDVRHRQKFQQRST
jgi:hypothetical protein